MESWETARTTSRSVDRPAPRPTGRLPRCGSASTPCPPWAGLRLANASTRAPRRRQTLALEGTFWALFAAVAPLYFGLRSSILGAADTVLSTAVTAGSVAQAARVDLRAAAAIAPRLAWLLLASYVSMYMAVHNDDPCFGCRLPSHER